MQHSEHLPILPGEQYCSVLQGGEQTVMELAQYRLKCLSLLCPSISGFLNMPDFDSDKGWQDPPVSSCCEINERSAKMD